MEIPSFVLRTGSRRVLLCSLLSVLLAPGLSAAGVFGPDSVPSKTADDTERFYGIWKAVFFSNGQRVAILSAHDAKGYRNFMMTPNGNVPMDSGTFSAGNGRYQTSAPSPNNSGTYMFIDAAIVKCTNAAGQAVTWWRQSKSTDVDAIQDVKNAPPPPAALTPFMKK